MYFLAHGNKTNIYKIWHKKPYVPTVKKKRINSLFLVQQEFENCDHIFVFVSTKDVLNLQFLMIGLQQ